MPDPLLLAVGLLVIAALCVLQVTEGTRVSIAEFFLVPVAAVGWFAGLVPEAVNDRFGHEAGARVLGDVGHVLRGTVRTVDTVARLGGDEFAVLMPETGTAAAGAAAERSRSRLTRLTTPDGQPLRCSIGVATFSQPPGSVTEMMQAADKLMYAAKSGGKDRIEKAELGSESPAPPDARANSGSQVDARVVRR